MLTRPGFQPPLMRLRGYRGITVPGLTVDGRRVQGTREISRELDRLQPDPALVPADPTPYVEGRPVAALAREIWPDSGAEAPAVMPPEWLPERPRVPVA